MSHTSQPYTQHFSNNSNTNIVEWASQQKDIHKIKNLLDEASNLYYNTDKNILTDNQYDELLDYFNNLTNQKYKTIGAPIIYDEGKVKLPYHMGSMDKTKKIDGLVKWINTQNTERFVISPKLDGTSLMIVINIINKKNKNAQTYTRFLDIKLYTRGDSEHGKNLSHLKDIFVTDEIKSKILNNSNIKNSIIVLRGEMIVSKSNFTKFNDKFKSPRSMVNGVTNKKTIGDDINYIDFVVFEVIEPNKTPSSSFVLSKEIGFNTVEFISITKQELLNNLLKKNEDEIKDSLPAQILNNHKLKYNYEIDGIIITSDKFNTLPTSGNPEYSIAFKMNNIGRVTTVKSIIWNITKHGQIIPTIEFEKIKLQSSSVQKCSGFNAAFIFKNCLGPGAIIRVVLSGEVIPYITEVIKQANIPDMPKFGYEWNDSKININILDTNPELQKQQIVNFIKCIGIEHLSIGLVNHLYLNGYTTLSSILTIDKESLLKLDRIENKMADKIISNISIVLNEELPLENIMNGSLCFGHGFGLKKCKEISSKYPRFYELEPTKEELLQLHGWSDKSIDKFLIGIPLFQDFMKVNSYLKIKQNLSDSYSINIQNMNKNKNTISKVCITGKRDKGIIQYLKTHNIELSSSLTNDVDLLICEDTSKISGKIKTAIEKNTEFLSIVDFKEKYMV